jgi:hypothetical protein
MTSLTIKRIIAGVAGLIFAVVYGFWTMLLTGGGHGNFIWVGMFLFVEFFGLYFPLMAILAVDLRRRFTKVVFGSLMVFNLVASSIMIAGWIGESGGDRPSDYEKMMQISGSDWVVFSAAVHFLPTLIFAVLLIRSILAGPSMDTADDRVNLNLS